MVFLSFENDFYDMKNIILLFNLILLGFLGQAQSFNADLLKGMNVRNIGPAGMSGRITAIDVHPVDKDHIYVGSASGGVWESKNGGITWAPIFDNTGVLSIGSIEINKSNPSEIWVGTGEGNPRNSHNEGAGIFYTNNGGKDWVFKGLEKTRIIHRILVDPSNSNVVYAGALGAAWGPTEDRGVYKSTDKGNTWKKILYVNKETGVADMVMDPSNPNKILVALWEFGRKPYTFNSGGEGSGLYMTYDGGENWKELTSEEGLPKGDLGRIGIAIAKNKPNIIYALVEAKVNGLYKSMDGGENWKLVSEKNIGNRPFYYAELYVDPTNENRLYNIYTYVSKSEDGGKTFKTIADYGNGVHPDHHAFYIDDEDSDFVIDGNDGGLNISRDGGENWQFINNIPVGQFYHVNYDMDFPYNVYGGMQDNGSWIGPNTVYRNGGITNYDWQELYFGDGFDVVPDLTNSRYGYAMSQQGNIGRYDRNTGRTTNVKPAHPDGEKLRFNWNSAVAQDPFESCGLYFGSQYVHYSDDCGLSWEILSKDLTTNDTTKQKQHISGGLTIDATGAENYTTLLAIAPSPVDKKVIWTSSDDGLVHISKDGGETWVNVTSNILGMPKGAWIPQIEVSTSEAGTAYIAVNDYRRNNFVAYAYVTKDYGTTWKRIIDNSKINSFINSIVQDDVQENLLFAGADDGLYVSIDSGNSWTKWNEEMPPVQIRDIKIHPRDHDLILGTFGRALWVIDDIRPLRALAEDRSILNEKFALIESPDVYLTSNKSYLGVRFAAQADFRAPSKSRSATINYYVAEKKKEEKKMEEGSKKKGKRKKGKADDKKDMKDEKGGKKGKGRGKKKDKEIHYWVIDNAGDTIRTMKSDAKEGFNSLRWRKDMKGTRWPSKEKPRKDAREPGGPTVIAGTYKVVALYQGEKDSIELNVLPDPRAEYNKAKQEVLLTEYKNFNKTIDKARLGMDKIQAAKQTVKSIEKLSFALPDSSATKLGELNKEMLEKIAELEEIYEMPEGLKGIQRDPSKLSNTLGTTGWYLRNRWDELGGNTANLIRNSNKDVDEAVEKIDSFLDKDFEEYKTKVEAYDFDLFKKIEEVKSK